MSAKQLARLALIFGALLLLWGGAAMARHRDKAPTNSDAFRIPKLTRGTVDTILLTRPADTTVLTRKDTTNWAVNGHPAASQAIADLFTAFADTAPGSDLIAERKTSHASLGVDSAGGTRVLVKGGGRTLLDLIAGHRSSDFSGGYVRRPDQDATYELRGRLVEWLTRPSDEWRDHRIAGVPGDSVTAIEISTRHQAIYPAADGNEVGVVAWRSGGFVGGSKPVDGVPHDRREWVRHRPADGFGALLAAGPTDPAPPKGRDRTPDAPL